MEAVQAFELALKRLAVGDNELAEDISYDEAWRRTERILTRPLGRLEDAVPEHFVRDFARLKQTRNALAHEILLRWRLETNIGLATHREVVDGLVEVEAEFSRLAGELDEIADARDRARGIDPAEYHVSAEYLRDLFARAVDDDP